MKPVLLFVAVALSYTLIVMVSAQQCDLSAATTCVNDFEASVSNDCMRLQQYRTYMHVQWAWHSDSDLRLQITRVTDPAEQQRLYRDFCPSTCVTVLLRDCALQDPSAEKALNITMQGNLIWYMRHMHAAVTGQTPPPEIFSGGDNILRTNSPPPSEFLRKI